MYPPVFEARKFTKIEVTEKPEDEYNDIYIHKKGLIDVGIKIRDPPESDYGWDISKIQIKIMIDKKNNVQLWKKKIIPFEFKLKIKEALLNQDHEFIKVFNKELCHCLLSHEEIKEWKLIHEWSKQEISEIFVLAKSRKRSMEIEQALIKVTKLLHPSNEKISYLSQCSEGLNDKKVLQVLESWNVDNMSYPGFLDSLL